MPIDDVMGSLSISKTPENLAALIIEDNPDHLRLVKHSVAGLDAAWEMVPVGTMGEAVALLSRADAPRFAVILLDLNLPDGAGLINLKRLRECGSDAPIIVLTGDNNKSLAIEAIRQGAEDYIVKQEMSGRILVRAMRYAIERDRLRRELVRVSLTDELTGLHNRRAFLTLSRQQLALARRSWQPFLLMFADLDGLKTINDTFGHEAGDRAIAGTAAILRACFRDSDVVARLGGDEFAVLMPETSPDAVQIVEDRLHGKLEASDLSLSTGWARLTPGDDISLEGLMARADAALYVTKRAKGVGREAVLV
jgi:two-component system cell cycle response regulator